MWFLLKIVVNSRARKAALSTIDEAIAA